MKISSLLHYKLLADFQRFFFFSHTLRQTKCSILQENILPLPENNISPKQHYQARAVTYVSDVHFQEISHTVSMELFILTRGTVVAPTITHLTNFRSLTSIGLTLMFLHFHNHMDKALDLLMWLLSQL